MTDEVRIYKYLELNHRLKAIGRYSNLLVDTIHFQSVMAQMFTINRELFENEFPGLDWYDLCHEFEQIQENLAYDPAFPPYMDQLISARNCMQRVKSSKLPWKK